MYGKKDKNRNKYERIPKIDKEYSK